MTWLLLWAALECSYFPGVEYVETRGGETTVYRYTGEISLEAEARLLNYRGFHLFVGGGMATPVVPKELAAWWPLSLRSTVTAGVRLGALEIGYEHQCEHPVVPWGIWPPVVADKAGDRVYLRITTERGLPIE